MLRDWKSWTGVLFKELDARMWMEMIYKDIIKTYRQSAADRVHEILEHTGFKAGNSEIRSIIAQTKVYYCMEMEFNALGYTLINEGKKEDALEIFTLTAELYPESANAYDSLGEAYMAAGNTQLAISNYEKSLQLNTQNTNAEEKLKVLKGK
jgi:tetratricopeptide (TPR) repeat protein